MQCGFLSAHSLTVRYAIQSLSRDAGAATSKFIVLEIAKCAMTTLPELNAILIVSKNGVRKIRDITLRERKLYVLNA